MTNFLQELTNNGIEYTVVTNEEIATAWIKYEKSEVETTLDHYEAMKAELQTVFIMSVRNKETNEIKVVEYEAKTAKEAKKDWRDNGYTVRFMATNQDDFDTECEKFYKKIEDQVSMRKIMKEVRANY